MTFPHLSGPITTDRCARGERDIYRLWNSNIILEKLLPKLTVTVQKRLNRFFSNFFLARLRVI